MSFSEKRMTSSSIEPAGFPLEMKTNINISEQRVASSILKGFLKSNQVLSDKDTPESLCSEDDEKSVQSEEMEKSVQSEEMEESVQSEEIDYESRCNEESREAPMVQARYKGHLVRMSRPLLQLKEIAGIEARLKKLKELAGDGAFLDFLRRKESLVKLAIKEETMELLLRLENIRGSHTLVHQIWKSVAGEIVSLQQSFKALPSKSINTSR